MEPQMNADERRFNASVSVEKDRPAYLCKSPAMLMGGVQATLICASHGALNYLAQANRIVICVYPRSSAVKKYTTGLYHKQLSALICCLVLFTNTN